MAVAYAQLGYLVEDGVAFGGRTSVVIVLRAVFL